MADLRVLSETRAHRIYHISQESVVEAHTLALLQVDVLEFLTEEVIVFISALVGLCDQLVEVFFFLLVLKRVVHKRHLMKLRVSELVAVLGIGHLVEG